MRKSTTIFTLLLEISAASVIYDGRAAPSQQVINTDIAIIGGGSAGTYAAIRLREDFNKSIVLIESRASLDGYVETYHLPETNITFDYGVQFYIRNEAATNFFARFDVALQPYSARPLNTINVDVETGKELKDYITPTEDATRDALNRWLTIVSKYQDYLEPGYWGFPQPANIPAELLIPFGGFAKSHDLDAAIPRIIEISGVGYGGIGNLITLHIMQAFGATITQQVLENQLVVPVGSSSPLYERALALLGKDVLLSSVVLEVNRTWTSATLRVKQGDTEYLINAKRILYTLPPKVSDMEAYHLDASETAVFSEFTNIAEYVGVAKISCIPENYCVDYIPAAVVPSNQLALRDWPYSLRLDSIGPSSSGLFRVMGGANFTQSTKDFEGLVVDEVRNLLAAGTVAGTCNVRFEALSDHSRPVWQQTAEQIKAGFVQNLNALQDYHGMYYSGSTWGAPYSSLIWANTDILLGLMIKALKHDPVPG